MKAIQLVAKDQDPVLSEVDKPNVAEGKRLIKVSYASLNHRDLWIAKGQYARIQYPVIPGSDVCGYLEDKRVIVNPGFNWGNNDNYQSKEFQILGLPENGCFAEYVLVPEEYIYTAPSHLKDHEAAALPLAGITAYRALFTKCKPIPGENIFISGIGGGVALTILQFAIAFGLNVFVSSSDEKKIEKAISLGAKSGINYNEESWEKEMMQISGGFDIIVDSAAGNTFNKFIHMARPGARICLYGGTQGLITDLSPQILFWKQLSMFGSTMGTQQEFHEMIQFVTEHKIVPVVDSIYPLHEIHSAFEKMHHKEQFGKIVLQVAS
jgi:zinc-binding alcohol dehydrogenase/oxidoreductase